MFSLRSVVNLTGDSSVAVVTREHEFIDGSLDCFRAELTTPPPTLAPRACVGCVCVRSPCATRSEVVASEFSIACRVREMAREQRCVPPANTSPSDGRLMRFGRQIAGRSADDVTI